MMLLGREDPEVDEEIEFKEEIREDEVEFRV